MLQLNPAGLQFIAGRLQPAPYPPRVRLNGHHPRSFQTKRLPMNGSTLVALLTFAAVLLLVGLASGATLPPFPGMRSGIVSVSVAPTVAHKAC